MVSLHSGPEPQSPSWVKSLELFKINQIPFHSSDGGPLCLPAHSPSSLGGVSVKILRRSGIQLCSIQFQVSGFPAFVLLNAQNLIMSILGQF